MFLRLNYSTFPFIQKYPLFHYFSIMLERIALLYYFRWLVESLISYFDIFHLLESFLLSLKISMLLLVRNDSGLFEGEKNP